MALVPIWRKHMSIATEIQRVFADRSVSQSVTRQRLEEARDHIEELLETLAEAEEEPEA